MTLDERARTQSQAQDLLDAAVTGRMSRRDVMRRGAALGLSLPVIGAILAACGGDDDDDDVASTPTTGGGAAMTPAAGMTPSAAMGTAAPEGTESPSTDATASPGMGSGGEMTMDNPPEVANADAASAFSGAKLTYYGDGVGVGNDLDTALAAKFTEATGITIEVIPRPEQATETYALYQRAFQAKSADIDVLMLDVIWPGAFAQHLTDLTEAMADVTDGWYPSIVENNTIDGKLVGAPWFGDFGILYYRTDLLDKYGFDGPPTTWDELEEQARTIMEGEVAANANFTGYVYQGNAYEGLTCNALEWIASVGGGTIIEDGEVTIDNDEAAAILDQIASWVGDISPTGVTAYTEEDARNAWQGGNAAFMRNWPYAYSLAGAADSAVAGNFDVGPLPAGDGQDPVGTLGGWQLAVSAYSDAPEAGIEFVKYMTSADVVKWRAIVGSFVPLVIDVAEDPDVIAAQPYLENLASVVRVTRPSRETGEDYNQVSTEIFQGINEILNAGGGAEDVLPDIASRVERLVG